MKKAENIAGFLVYKLRLPYKVGYWIMRITSRYLVEKSIKRERHRVRKILDKRVKNPVYDLPRNGPCVCGSGQKLKTCCLFKFPTSCTGEEYLNLEKLIKWSREKGLDEEETSKEKSKISPKTKPEENERGFRVTDRRSR